MEESKTYQGYDLNKINTLFKELLQYRDPNYFEKKLESGEATSPLTYFLNKYLNCSIQEVITYKSLKTTSSDNYYVFITENKTVLTKDYEDPCSLNFCVSKNPILVTVNTEIIENILVKKETFQIILNIATTPDIKGNIM